MIHICGGESKLVNDLIAASYEDVIVPDISQVALDVSRTCLGAARNSVT